MLHPIVYLLKAKNGFKKKCQHLVFNAEIFLLVLNEL